ncbi:MAG: T9SS type A sorting domain-containing protein [Bacteroidia bacterium]
MKKYLFILFLLSTTFVGWGQNLVPNGGFEGYIGCPTSLNQFDSVLFWINPTAASVDYYNQCGSQFVGVPDNILGSQQAHSGGAYCGIVLIADSAFPNYREYIEANFISPLIANACYHFEMYVNAPDKVQSITDDIGIYFSDTLIDGINNDSLLVYIPQLINTTGFISDTINWVLISGNYTATGGENYLIIGNFKDDANTSVITDTSEAFHGAYIYIDDVSLTLCTGINETSNNTSTFTISPNPAGEELKVQCSMFNVQEKEIKIYDMMGKEILKSAINFQSSIINIQSLKSGIYFIEINGVRKKFVKN